MKTGRTGMNTQSKGQAMIEAMVSISALGIILLASATLYQIMQADLDASKSARVAAWHGVLYQGETEEAYNNLVRANLRDTGLVDEVRDLINNGADSLVGSVDDVEFMHENVDPTYTYPSNRSSYVANRAGLNENRVADVSVSIPLKDAEIFETFTPTSVASYETSPGSVPYDPVAGSYRFHVKARAALLSNGFVPMSEAEFTESISNIAADGSPMALFEPLSGGLNLLGFDEIDAARGDDGLSTVATEQSRVLPPQMGTFTP
jgi:hypothetical protein